MRTIRSICLAVILLLCVHANAQASSWTLVSTGNPWNARSELSSTSFDNKVWVMGGIDDTLFHDVWNSSDGIHWTSCTLQAPWKSASYPIVVLKDKMWLIDYYHEEVWSSSNGTDWTSATLSPPWGSRSGAGVVVFKDRLWLMGGGVMTTSTLKSDVWCSDNGSTWTLVNAHSPWALRDFASCVFNDRIWIFGGLARTVGADYLIQNTTNDIWWSSDGSNWILEPKRAYWKDRMQHTVLVVDGKLWLMGGSSMNGDAGLEDLWCSDNGIHWSPVPFGKIIPYRHSYGLAVLGSRIYLTGGVSSINGEVQQYNDVYELSPVFTYRPDSAKGWETYK